MTRSLFGRIEEIASQLQRGAMSKKASNVPETSHPVGKADPGTEEAETGEWDKETDKKLREEYDSTVAEDSYKAVEPESEAEGAEVEVSEGEVTEELVKRDAPKDDTDHPANAEKAAFVRWVKSASLNELIDYSNKLASEISKKQAELVEQQLAYALGSIIKSAEDVADTAVEEAKKKTEDEEKEEAAGEADKLVEDDAQTEEVVDMVAQILDADPQLADDVVGALVEGGAITEEDATEILGRELGTSSTESEEMKKESMRKKSMEKKSILGMVATPESPEEVEQVMQQGEEMLNSLIDSLAQNPDVVVRILASFVEGGAMTEEDAQEVLDKLGIDVDIREVLREGGSGGAAPEGEDVDQVADQVVGALMGGTGGPLEQASEQLLDQMEASPPPEIDQVIKQSSNDDISTAAIDAARELGLTFGELSKCGKDGAAIAKLAAEFQRSGKYKIQTHKEGSTMRRLVDYMKEYFIELLNKSR